MEGDFIRKTCCGETFGHSSFCSQGRALDAAREQGRREKKERVPPEPTADLLWKLLEEGKASVEIDYLGYRIQYHAEYRWCASSLRTGAYLGDPQRFYPLRDLLKLLAEAQ